MSVEFTALGGIIIVVTYFKTVMKKKWKEHQGCHRSSTATFSDVTFPMSLKRAAITARE